MADYEVRRRAHIGTSSLILIFIVLCLATFGILSLESARQEETFSQKNASAVQEYYRADSEGEAFVQTVDQALMAAQNVKDAGERKKQVIDMMGAFYQESDDRFCTVISMDSGLALRVELAADWENGTSRVLIWKVFDQEMYEIDQSVPVWTGEEA